MSVTTNGYEIISKYYDSAYAKKADLTDLPFYLELAERAGGPVLEIACGIGRVMLPVARKGIEIHGVDNSAPMLAVLREHVAKEPVEVQRRVHQYEGDMRDFRLGREFPLVMIPFRPMQHMLTVDDQVSALKTAAAHLGPGGTLAFDVFYPKYEVMWEKVGEEVLELEWASPEDPSLMVRRYFKKESVDKIGQIFYFTFIFRTYRGEEMVREEREAFSLGYYTYPHLRALFRLAGLEVMEEYGSFEKAALDNDARQMIFVLRKS